MIVAYVLGGGWPSHVVHAAEQGSRTTLCGEPVGRMGEEWPGEGQETTAFGNAEICVFCQRLVEHQRRAQTS